MQSGKRMSPSTESADHEESIKFIAPAMAAAGIAGALLLAPIASADTDPLIPNGSDPHSSYVLGEHFSNHDEANQSAGYLDTSF